MNHRLDNGMLSELVHDSHVELVKSKSLKSQLWEGIAASYIERKHITGMADSASVKSYAKTIARIWSQRKCRAKKAESERKKRLSSAGFWHHPASLNREGEGVLANSASNPGLGSKFYPEIVATKVFIPASVGEAKSTVHQQASTSASAINQVIDLQEEQGQPQRIFCEELPEIGTNQEGATTVETEAQQAQAEPKSLQMRPNEAQRSPLPGTLSGEHTEERQACKASRKEELHQRELDILALQKRALEQDSAELVKFRRCMYENAKLEGRRLLALVEREEAEHFETMKIKRQLLENAKLEGRRLRAQVEKEEIRARITTTSVGEGIH